MIHPDVRLLQHQQQLQGDARFSCSICTEAVIEPVVTHCGHLYCWPCLYRWLENGMTTQERNELLGLSSIVLMNTLQHHSPYDPSKRVCPVCRAPCSVKRVIPIYVRTDVSAHNSRHRRTPTARDADDSVGVAAAATADDDDESNAILFDTEEVVEVETVDDYDDMVIVQDEDDTHDIADHDDDGAASLLHSTGLRNRSRIRSSISEISDGTTNTPIHMFDTDDNDNNLNNDENHYSTGTSSRSNNSRTDIPRRPVARSSSNLRLADHADVVAAAALQQQQQYSRSPTGSSPSTASSQQHHPASLSHGMLPLVQQVIRHAAIVAGGGSGGMGGAMNINNNNDYIPPIHRLDGMNTNNSTTITTTNNNNTNQQQQQQSSNYNIPSMDYIDRTDFLSWILLLLGIFVLACLMVF